MADWIMDVVEEDNTSVFVDLSFEKQRERERERVGVVPNIDGNDNVVVNYGK